MTYFDFLENARQADTWNPLLGLRTLRFGPGVALGELSDASQDGLYAEEHSAGLFYSSFAQSGIYLIWETNSLSFAGNGTIVRLAACIPIENQMREGAIVRWARAKLRVWK